jgi:hypothetical protein
MSWGSPHEVRQRLGDDDDDWPLSERGSFFSYPSGGCDYSSGGGGGAWRAYRGSPARAHLRALLLQASWLRRAGITTR